jgi:hypothetical protein
LLRRRLEREGESTEPVDVKVEADHAQTTYTPRVTIQDIKDGFGKCVGTTCTINGRVWD